MRVLFAGSFHPPTEGHVDVIRTAASMFDGVIAAIMVNPNKKYTISAEERLSMLNRCLNGIPNAEAVIGTGLTAELALRLGAGALVRGVRTTADFEYELQMADVNRKLYGIETVLIPAKPHLGFVASSIVMDIARNGGSIAGFVPEIIEDDIAACIKREIKGE